MLTPEGLGKKELAAFPDRMHLLMAPSKNLGILLVAKQADEGVQNRSRRNCLNLPVQGRQNQQLHATKILRQLAMRCKLHVSKIRRVSEESLATRKTSCLWVESKFQPWLQPALTICTYSIQCFQTYDMPGHTYMPVEGLLLISIYHTADCSNTLWTFAYLFQNQLHREACVIKFGSNCKAWHRHQYQSVWLLSMCNQCKWELPCYL